MGKEDYKNEKKGHGFLCVPKELLFDNRYKQLTIEAILLYAYMLDRLKLSIENGWKDSDGKVFIYFSLESIMDLLKCSKGKAISTLKELDEKHGIGLIEKKRSGYGKCYVKSVISIIESNYHKLTSAEKTVADFFIHNNQNTDFSSSHIAELLYTSKATLSRFAKKIGYRGYQEFIYQYENTFEEKEEKITGNTKIVLNAYQEVLNKTYNLVDEAQIGRIVGYLNKADRVLVCGCGSSGLSAKEMEIRFMRIGIDVDSMTDSDMIKMASVFQNRRSLIFGFSISGEREEVTYLLREAYNKGAKTVLFTTNNGKKFSEYYSEVVALSSLRHLNYGNVISPQFPILIILDIIYAYYVEQNKYIREGMHDSTLCALEE